MMAAGYQLLCAMGKFRASQETLITLPTADRYAENALLPTMECGAMKMRDCFTRCGAPVRKALANLPALAGMKHWKKLPVG